MRGATSWWLLVVTLALGMAVWLTRQDASRRESLVSGGRVFTADVEDVTELSIRGEGGIIRLVRKDREWFLDAPVRARADGPAVDRMLATLDGLGIAESITVAERNARELGLADYGLAKPHLSFCVVSHRGPEMLHIGAAAPLGARVFAKRDGSGDVLLIARDVLDIVPASAATLRDRGLVRGAVDKAARLEIQSAARGFIQLTRQDGAWTLQQPVVAPADQAAVTRLLSGLFDARIADFVWDPGPDDPEAGSMVAARAQFESCGLSDDMAVLRVGLWLEGDRLGQELVCGRELPDDSALAYARRRDVTAVYAVDAALLRLFDVQANALRDRRIFAGVGAQATGVTVTRGETKLVLERVPEGWVVREPVEWKADPETVAGLFPRLAVLHAESYLPAGPSNFVALGLAPPAYTLEVRTGATDVKRLALGPISEASETVWGRQAERDEVVALPRSDVAWIALYGADPLFYRDRTVLALPPESVRRLARRVGESVQVVERAEGNGAWQVADGGGGAVAVTTVAAIVENAVNLRALRIECRSPESLVPFGLDDSAVALTFGLRGGAGIQKTLLLGFLSRTDGIYGMIRGQDVVFVLARAQVEALMRDLVVAERDQPSVAAGAEPRQPADGSPP